MEETVLRCEQCGGTEFRADEDAAHSVCVVCGMESQQTLNVATDEWADEAAMYQRGSGRISRRRKSRPGRKRKAKVELPEPMKSEALRQLVMACADALVSHGIPDRLRVCTAETWAAVDETDIDLVLPALYFACRKAEAGVSVWDIEHWAWSGILPYLDCWEVLSQRVRDSFLGRRAFLTAKHVPTPEAIATVAQLRVAKSAGPISAVHAPSLVRRFVFELGIPDFVSEQAELLVRLSGAKSESRLLCCVVLACLRYHDVTEWDVVENPDPVAAAFPWTQVEADFGMPRRSECRAFCDFAARVVYRDFEDGTPRAAVASLLKSVDCGTDFDREVGLGPLYLLGPHLRSCSDDESTSSDVKRRKVPRSSLKEPPISHLTPSNLVDIAARYVSCPIYVLQEEIDALLDCLDAIARSGNLGLSADLELDIQLSSS